MRVLRESSSRRRFLLIWAIPTAAVVIVAVVIAAQLIVSTQAGAGFIARYPGTSELPEGSPVGIPAWLAWQHGLNAFFILFIVRSGWTVRTAKRPDAYWTRRNAGLIRTARPPARISVTLWSHLVFDTLWTLNGVIYLVLLFATGQWVRVVPTSWDILPNAVSALIQYASLDWPTENGWVNYNALQVLAYFLVIFVAAPLALVTGLRMSPGLAARWQRGDRAFPMAVARRIHFPVMLFFVAFVVVHVTLVLTTGALRNLNHMFFARDDSGWSGVIVFAASVLFSAGAWIALSPLVLRTLAALVGRVGR